MDEPLDHIDYTSRNPVEFFKSVGFTIVRQKKDRVPVGSWNFYITQLNLEKEDQFNQQWSIHVKYNHGEVGEGTSFELKGIVELSIERKPISIVSNERSIGNLFRSKNEIESYQISGIQVNQRLKALLGRLADNYVSIQVSGFKLEFRMLIDDSSLKNIGYLLEIIELLILPPNE